MKFLFTDGEHENFVCKMLEKSGKVDRYRMAFFYTMGIMEETRNHIESLYDFKKNEIKLEGLEKGWQTGTSIKICRLAFNLFNGFCGEDDNKKERVLYTPYELFDCEYALYMLEAIKLRYHDYIDIDDDF